MGRPRLWGRFPACPGHFPGGPDFPALPPVVVGRRRPLALRAAATGARVAVETGRPQAWAQTVHAMGGGQNGLAVYEVGRVPPQGASAGTPVLVVRDCGMRPPRGRVASGPWQAVLTLLPYLSPVAPRLLRQARLVGARACRLRDPGPPATVPVLTVLTARWSRPHGVRDTDHGHRIRQRGPSDE